MNLKDQIQTVIHPLIFLFTYCEECNALKNNFSLTVIQNFGKEEELFLLFLLGPAKQVGFKCYSSGWFITNNQDHRVYLLLSTRLQPPGSMCSLIHIHVSVDSEKQRFLPPKQMWRFEMTSPCVNVTVVSSFKAL